MESESNANKIICGNLQLNTDRLEAQLGEELIRLSSLEFKLVKLLLENRERVTTRKEILQEVWGTTKIADRVIDAHIVSIRKKLKDFDQSIESVYGVGYALRTT